MDGLTHLELLPVNQNIRLTAVGLPADRLRADPPLWYAGRLPLFHQCGPYAAGLNVILRLGAGPFPSDEFTAELLDGTHSYGYQRLRARGRHRDFWNTLIYKSAVVEVSNYLVTPCTDGAFWD